VSLYMGLYSKIWRFWEKNQLQQGLYMDLHFPYSSKFPLPPSISGGPPFPPPNVGPTIFLFLPFSPSHLFPTRRLPPFPHRSAPPSALRGRVAAASS
jgi:hypothetical protein